MKKLYNIHIHSSLFLADFEITRFINENKYTSLYDVVFRYESQKKNKNLF